MKLALAAMSVVFLSEFLFLALEYPEFHWICSPDLWTGRTHLSDRDCFFESAFRFLTILKLVKYFQSKHKIHFRYLIQGSTYQKRLVAERALGPCPRTGPEPAKFRPGPRKIFNPGTNRILWFYQFAPGSPWIPDLMLNHLSIYFFEQCFRR